MRDAREGGGKVGGVGRGGGFGVIDAVGGDLFRVLVAVGCYQDGSLF